MVQQSLTRRLNQVERTLAPRKGPRFFVRFEGPGSERFPQPTDEEIGENRVFVVQFLPALDWSAR
jgi:hypothetical protein